MKERGAIILYDPNKPSGFLACSLSADLLLSGASKYLTVRDRYPVREIQENGVEKRKLRKG